MRIAKINAFARSEFGNFNANQLLFLSLAQLLYFLTTVNVCVGDRVGPMQNLSFDAGSTRFARADSVARMFL